MKRKSYPSDLTDAQWALLAPLIPKAWPGGRPRAAGLREVLNALFYRTREGCTWRALPHDFPPWKTAYNYFRKFTWDGTWQKVLDSPDQRPAQLVDRGGDLAGHRVVMRQTGLGHRKGVEVIVGDGGVHGQRWRAVGRVAACRHAAELSVDLRRDFLRRHPRRQQCERPVAHRAGVERSLTPPGQVTLQDVGGVEAAASNEAFGQA
jgi:hypothetical protein